MSITGGSIEGGTGDLIADATTGNLFWTGNDSAPFWLDDAELFWRDSYKEMVYQVTVNPISGHAGDQYLLLETDLTVAAISWLFEYQGGGVFKPWPGTLGPIDDSVDYVFRLTTAPGKVQGRVSRFEMRIATIP